MLHLLTFGGCHVERDGVRLDDLSAMRKALGLLALLAEAGTHGVSRVVEAARPLAPRAARRTGHRPHPRRPAPQPRASDE